jgi:TonB family protein
MARWWTDPDGDATARRRLTIGVGLSLLIHLLLVVVLTGLQPPEKPEKAAEPIRFKVVDRKPGVPATLLPGKSGPERPTGEVIDIPRPPVERVPADARFLSRWNTSTDHEQKARDRGAHHKQRPPAEAGQPSPPAGAQGRPGPEVRRPGAEARQAPPGSEKPGEGSRLPPGARGGPAGTGQEPTLHGLAGLDKLLVPSLDGGSGQGAGKAMRALTSNAVSDDALLGVDQEGDSTMVNSRSFKYWDFFQRVKERVREEWDPGPSYRARDPYGKVYGTRDRLTILNVILDEEGHVNRLEVLRESGLPFLDQEAIRSFREAGPFPNPPRGLADGKGRIAFHFGFLLEMGSSRFKMFWQQPE